MTFKKTALAAAVALGASSAFAFPTFVPGTNSINFDTFENQYRPTIGVAPGVGAPNGGAGSGCNNLGGCLAADGANDPAGFRQVDPTLLGNVAQGDIFAGVLIVNRVNPGDFPLNVPSATKEFTGYFAQEVDSVDGTVPTAAIIKFKTVTTDPFSKLGAGEMFRLYTDTSPDFNPAGGGTTFAQIGRATDGGLGTSFWAALGLGTEGYAYTIDNLLVSGADASFVAKSFVALDRIFPLGPAYNAGELNKVNDQSEALFGGVTTGNQLICSGGNLSDPTVVCTDFAGNSDIKKNTFFPALSPFRFNANDPLFLNVIPEPGSLALFGLALAGLGLVRRRRSV